MSSYINPNWMPTDVIILTGGEGSRMGNVSKPLIPIAGQRIIDYIMGDLELLHEAAFIRRIVLVGPDIPNLPPYVIQVSENPRGVGPVGGISAGLQVLGLMPMSDAIADQLASNQAFLSTLDQDYTDTLIALAPGDNPLAGQAVELLMTDWLERSEVTMTPPSALMAQTADTQLHYLHTIMTREAMTACVDAARSMSGRLREFLAPANATPVAMDMNVTWDCDTPQDITAMERFLTSGY